MDAEVVVRRNEHPEGRMLVIHDLVDGGDPKWEAKGTALSDNRSAGPLAPAKTTHHSSRKCSKLDGGLSCAELNAKGGPNARSREMALSADRTVRSLFHVRFARNLIFTARRSFSQVRVTRVCVSSSLSENCVFDFRRKTVRAESSSAVLGHA